MLHCVYDKNARISARQNCTRKPFLLLRLLAIINADLVVMKVDDQLNCPAWDNPFFSSCLSALKQPKVIDEFANRRPGSIGQIDHKTFNQPQRIFTLSFERTISPEIGSSRRSQCFTIPL